MGLASLNHVSKRFRTGEHHESLASMVSSGLKRILGRTASPNCADFQALSDVSFEVAAGQGMAVIGPNGAGKSTILKLLAGIIRPDSGTVHTAGRTAALIEVGAGFHGDLTGRENVFLNAALLGMSRAETRSKLDSIVAFAGIDRFLDTPVKRYSSGMYARLGFSVAVHVDPEVLLVDEVLSVGDAMFRVRCLDRMRELLKYGTALVLVTHDLDQMRSICSRTLVLEQGRVGFDGTPSAAAAHYLLAMSRSSLVRETDIRVTAESPLRVKQFTIRNGFGDDVICVGHDHFVQIELELLLSGSHRRTAMELNLRRVDGGDNVLSFNSARSERLFEIPAGKSRIALDIPALPLRGGQYFWNIRAWDSESGATLLDTPFAYPMVVDDGGKGTGMLSLQHEWTLRSPTQNPRWNAPSPGKFDESYPIEARNEHLFVC